MGINKLKFFFDMIGDILSLISFLIYSEIIELNFLDFNKNTRRKLRRDDDINHDNPHLYVDESELNNKSIDSDEYELKKID